MNQTCEKLMYGAFNLSVEHSEMRFEEFEETSKQKENELFGLNGMSIDDIENMHWSQICTERKYSINNNMSLFGDCVKIWNINKFTKSESNIHATQPHYGLDVSANEFDLIFIYIFEFR